MEKIWLDAYPPGVPADIDTSAYRSLAELIDQGFREHADKVAYTFMGEQVRFADTDRDSRRIAAWLQSLGLSRGDRVALMMPNMPQYPAAVAAVIRAGCVVVNVNPLYTARELEHQLRDSGAKAIFVLENFAHTLQKCLARTAIEHIVLCATGDRLGWLKGTLVNLAVRHLKKMVPAFELPKALRFNEVLARGGRLAFRAPELGPDDLALLQYTGGTTGVAKGAMLLHRNVTANVLQSEAWHAPATSKVPGGEQHTFVCALPLYHIFAFTVIMMLALRTGSKCILVPNPRDLKATLKTLSQQRFHVFPAVGTLFAGLANHADFGTVDWSGLRLTVAGGAAVSTAVTELWEQKTGSKIREGYGLSETSPSAACNPTAGDGVVRGSIGIPLPSTEFALLDDDGHEVAMGEPGEIAIRGPQVMAGYWQRPEDTAKVMTSDGFMRTGDIATVDERGFFRIVDRKKDMILVSGFNVYPNEIENVVASMPGVAECAVVGVPDDKTGEAVKLVVVRRDAGVSEQQVRAYCQENLTGYKRPRVVEFRDQLPKTPIGKVLRRELRDKA
ncbi:AMP-binding protein [Xylophilus rhododendri]|uniref:Long-chain-fatty-acid--CoA ligase n=1 Tax=Xylophilus rhododendri TaxID=2697032 RepID=A0A857J6R2_9BURK|nr:AMP-binding protein [Xylophilus rhododendri]QHI98702.1 AMP-binding protein [Xylophilus rhododendri]